MAIWALWRWRWERGYGYDESDGKYGGGQGGAVADGRADNNGGGVDEGAVGDGGGGEGGGGDEGAGNDVPAVRPAVRLFALLFL